MKECAVLASGIRFSVYRSDQEVGHAYLYVLKNDLHDRPFGLLEDVCVNPQYRGQRIASQLLAAAIKKAQKLGCYKLLATSRDDGTRVEVHEWYKRSGFVQYGLEFRYNFKEN